MNHRHARRGSSSTLLVVIALAACGAPPTPPPNPEPNEPVVPAPVTPQASSSLEQQTLRLSNGVTAHLRVAPTGSDTRVQLGIFAGTTLVAPGLAELAAHVLVESSDPTSGRASLRRQLQALGGAVDVQVGLMTTWLDIRTPTNKTIKALEALRGALESVTQSRSQIERMRTELVTEFAARVASNPIPVVTRGLLQGERGTGSYLNSLLDLDPSDVSLFQSRLYRPDLSLLTIAAPQPLQETIKAVQAPAETAMAGWKPPPPIPGRPKILDRPYSSGLYWAETPGLPGLVRTAIMMRLPDASMDGAAEWLMMHACLTLDGTGGRLEQMQDEAGLPQIQWRTHIEQTPDAQALVLSAMVSPEVAAALWRVLNRARQSLSEVPPTPSELELALRRAQLNATLPTMSDAARLRLAAQLETRNLAPDALARRLRELADPSRWDLAKAAAAFQQTPAWMVVVGAEPAPDMPGVIKFDALPQGFEANISSAPTPQVIAATGPWLIKARAAMGGEEVFEKLKGFRATARLTAAQAPPAEQETIWDRSGRLTRQRKLLGQVVMTNLDKGSWTETLGKVKKSLTAPEARLLRHEMMRHPLMLLAAHKRGAIQFRPIAQRNSGDREMMVLEALGTEFDRLRIHIDTESYLIRTVESWERLPDETLVRVHETWSDYRAAGEMRAPHRLRTMWNDGEHQTETVFSEWLPTLKP